MLTTLLIDDEEDSRCSLRNFLTRYCANVHIAGEADSVAAALPLIREHDPGLVFLDINMPHENGFSLFREIPEPGFQTIFVTAYDEYALQAIKQHALDYILKPVSIAELVAAVDRAQVLQDQQEAARLGADRAPAAMPLQSLPGKIGLPTTNGFVFVPVKDIVRCEAEGNYTLFHFSGRKPILVCRTLGDYELLLKDQGFVRVHHRHLVSLDHVEQYQRGRGGTILMSDGREVVVSQRKKDIFLNAIHTGSLHRR